MAGYSGALRLMSLGVCCGRKITESESVRVRRLLLRAVTVSRGRNAAWQSVKCGNEATRACARNGCGSCP